MGVSSFPRKQALGDGGHDRFFKNSAAWPTSNPNFYSWSPESSQEGHLSEALLTLQWLRNSRSRYVKEILWKCI